jgi:threonine/homoserine/homoserine lactone efflux protein
MCGSFLLVAVVLVLLPGPDFAAVAKNTLAGGRLRAWSRAVRVTCSNAVQGVAVATGLGAVCVQPLFEAIKWAGIPYLVLQALRSAAAGRYIPFGPGGHPAGTRAAP